MTAWHLIAVMIFMGIGAVIGMVAAFVALCGELDLELRLGRKEKDYGNDNSNYRDEFADNNDCRNEHDDNNACRNKLANR